MISLSHHMEDKAVLPVLPQPSMTEEQAIKALVHLHLASWWQSTFHDAEKRWKQLEEQQVLNHGRVKSLLAAY
ncbi:hypothetical protein MHYP_G00087470 [Metynnis hypsauchen]